MSKTLAEDFLHFVNASPSPFHAVQSSRDRLLSAGFVEVKERTLSQSLKPNGKYFVTRNQSSIIAFAVGGKYVRGNGVSIVAAHTDSPCLKVKPVSKRESQGFLQLGVQPYGGALFHTWFDRDLSLAGRVICRGVGSSLVSRLVRISRPILRIPTLAIHLDREVSEKLVFNKETHLCPVFATAVKAKLNAPASSPANPSTISTQHHPALLRVIADECAVDVDDIVDFELCLYDTQPACVGGLFNEFIFSPRLDNLMMSFCSLKSLLASLDGKSLESEESIRLVALFDNEEVGSASAYGADSSFLEDVLRRFAAGGSDPCAFEQSIQSSFLISADMAHAIHPNYSEKHEINHQPHFHAGVVIKNNANQRYATTAVTSALLKQIAGFSAVTKAPRATPIPLQEFVVRNDSACGSTIGPILSSKLGLRTIDVGTPQLSMHSIREMCGVDDIGKAVDLFTAFFQEFSMVDKASDLETYAK